MKAAYFLAALLFAGAIDAAQHHSLGHARLVHHRARPGRVIHPARPMRQIAIPQESAPPQEAFASFPDAQQAPGPAAVSACDRQLDAFAVARPLGALVAPGECGAPDAVLLQSVTLPDQSKVAVVPAATLRCPMAAAVAQWVREDVAPAAAKLGAPLRRLEDLGSYDCRGRDGVSGATLSEHGRANAIDLRAFKLGNGKVVVLADPGAPEDFRAAVRQSACARFMTVLGPGADAAHSGHVHVDLAPRHNDYKICEWDLQKPAQPAAVARSGDGKDAGAGKNPRSKESSLAGTGETARSANSKLAGAGKDARSKERALAGAGETARSANNKLAGAGKDARGKEGALAGAGETARSANSKLAGAGTDARGKEGALAGAGETARSANSKPAGAGKDARGKEGKLAGAGETVRSENSKLSGTGETARSKVSTLAGTAETIPPDALPLPLPRPRVAAAFYRTRRRPYRPAFPRWERAFVSAFFPHRKYRAW